MILAVDPGKRTGFALGDATGTPKEFFKIEGEDAALDYLESEQCADVEIMVIEVYRNRGNSHDKWSDMPTSQHIGAIKRIARKRGWRVVEQEPHEGLVGGLKFLGLYTQYATKVKGRLKLTKHVPDEISALAHYEFYCRKARLK
jgi:hypothetical protein